MNIDDFNGELVRKNRIKKCEDVHSFINSIRNDRTTATTQLNTRSSRTHLITTLTIVSATQMFQSRVIFADLAGFESLNDADVKTSTFINSSLSSLQSILGSLMEGGERHSYRNSLLTRALQPHLTRETKVFLLVTVKLSMTTLRSDLNALRTVSTLTGKRRRNK